jgi:hypothetical protein
MTQEGYYTHNISLECCAYWHTCPIILDAFHWVTLKKIFVEISLLPLRVYEGQHFFFHFSKDLSYQFCPVWSRNFLEIKIFTIGTFWKLSGLAFLQVSHPIIHIVGRFWSPFDIFFQYFVYHFVENQKLHNISQIQSGNF